jgi:beta-xylosidase
MRRTFAILITLCNAVLAFAQNPFITDIYTADPSAHVFNDTLYVYPSHDKDDARWFTMDDWHVYSTTDMVNWTDHGVTLSLDSISWATKWAWAPDCQFRNGKYYFYFPTDKNYIGVAVSDKPTGPFTDALGKPLISRETPGVVATNGLIDPTIFIDDDGTPYLVFGQNHVNIVKLNDNMVSFNDTVRIVEGAKDFFEAAWMHKYNGKYYLSYSGNRKILYATSDSPYGPFEYQGVVLGKVSSGNNHHSIVQYKGQWYIFYHNSALFFKKHPWAMRLGLLKRWYRRSICVDKLYYNPDGSIQKVKQTRQGVDKVE